MTTDTSPDFAAAAATADAKTQAQAAAQFERKPFMPDAVRADAIDLAAVIAASSDTKSERVKDQALQLTAEVHVPGLPNGKRNEDGTPSFGLVCKVKRYTAFQENQIVFKSREGAQLDDQKLFAIPTELTGAESRSSWWRDIWRLMYGLTDETKRYLAAIHLRNAAATKDMFTVHTAIHWLTCSESTLVAEPLLAAINILNSFSKDLNSSCELDEFKMFPSVLAELMVAYKGGYIKEFMSGEPAVAQFVVQNVSLLEELRLYVLDGEARTCAEYNKDAMKQAMREMLFEYYGEKPPKPTADMKLWHPEVKGDPTEVEAVLPKRLHQMHVDEQKKSETPEPETKADEIAPPPNDVSAGDALSAGA